MKIDEIDASLKGLYLTRISRCCNLVQFEFGETLNSNKKIFIHTVGSFSLGNMYEVILGSDDLYISNNTEDNSVDLSQKNVCIFDNIIQKMNLRTLKVVSACANNYGDLVIEFKDCRLLLFCDDTTEKEKWRIFEGKEDHLICYGKKIIKS